MKNIIQVSILAGVMSLCYACSGSESDLHEVTQEMQASRSTDVEATAALETAGTLETILKEAYGDDVANITKLTITGSYNGADHNFLLGTLKNLHTLDMKGATIVADSENGYSLGWSTYYLEDNTVSYRMFHALEALKTLVLPDNVDRIADYGLAELPIERVEFNAVINAMMGSHAFYRCKELVEVKAVGMAISDRMFYECSKLTTVGNILSGTNVLPYAFYGCSSLSDFDQIFRFATSAGDHAFDGCGFTTVRMDKGFKFGKYAFANNQQLTDLYLGNGELEIPEGAFKDCVNLKKVEVYREVNSIKSYSIESYAFSGCSSLTDYTPFNDATSIGDGAFQYCGFKELNLPEGVTTIGTAAFNNCYYLRTITVPASVTTTTAHGFFDYCSSLTSVFWNVAADVPGFSTNFISPNILLYINNESIKVNASWKNLIVNGVAQSITITPQRIFHCPQEFTAKSISYTRNFGLKTSIGGNEGWETIVLPFVPTAYAHESKGVIAPFDSETDTKKHFWLRSLTAEGFADVATMEANKPYIISMPNSDDYTNEYNLNGNVTFSATDVTVGATPETLESAAGPGFALQPVYVPTGTSVSIYALNVRKRVDSYAEGSVFAHSLDDTVQPFEAYAFLTESKSARQARVINVGKHTSDSRAVTQKNKTGIPQKDDMN